MLPDGAYRLLYEEREMVGGSYPFTDDYLDGEFLPVLFSGFPVFLSEVYPDLPVLRVRDDPVSCRDI